MGPVSISELKARLSECIRHVAKGERIVVTDRGEPVAVLAPISPTLDERRKRLIASGRLIPGTQKLPDDFWDWPRPSDPDGSVRAALIEERRTGR